MSETTTKAVNGIRPVFYIQVLDADGKELAAENHGDVFPDDIALECALHEGVRNHGRGVQVKIDKRHVLNYVDGENEDTSQTMWRERGVVPSKRKAYEAAQKFMDIDTADLVAELRRRAQDAKNGVIMMEVEPHVQFNIFDRQLTGPATIFTIID